MDDYLVMRPSDNINNYALTLPLSVISPVRFGIHECLKQPSEFLGSREVLWQAGFSYHGRRQ